MKSFYSSELVPAVITSFPSAESFLLMWEESRDFDVLFIDTRMKEIDSMEMARRVRERDSDIIIICTTDTVEHVEEGCIVESMHYLSNPIDHEELCRYMDQALRKEGRDNFLLVQTKTETLKLAIDKIMYVEAQGHGCVIEFCPQTGRTFQLETAENISVLEGRLDKKDFVRCHRSYIVRIDKIRRINRAWIELDNGSRIGVSRRLYSDVTQRFVRYLHKEKSKVGDRM